MFRVHHSNRIIEPSPGFVGKGWVDQGSYMIKRDITKEIDFDESNYAHDAMFIEELYKQYVDKTVFVPQFSIKWNGLDNENVK